MINKCLITKLKAKVDNSNLEVFGELVVSIKKAQEVEGFWIRIDPVEDVTLTIEGGSFRTGNRTVKVPAGNVSGFPFAADVEYGDVKIIIDNKYAITKLAISFINQSYVEPILASNVMYCPFNEDNMFSNGNPNIPFIFKTESEARKILSNGAYELNTSPTNIRYSREEDHFDLSWLTGLPISWIQASGYSVNDVIQPVYVYGDIASLGSCTNLKRFNFWNSFISGSWDNFVANARRAGRIEGILIVDSNPGVNANITFGNKSYFINGGMGRIKWDATHIVAYNGDKDDIDDANVTQILCIGYTDQEIEAWRNAGKTVVKCDK